MKRQIDLLLWFDYNESGDICRLGRINAVPADFDIRQFFEDYMKPPFAGGGVDGVTFEHIEVPETLMGIHGTAAVLWFNNMRFRAALPYFTTLG